MAGHQVSTLACESTGRFDPGRPLRKVGILASLHTAPTLERVRQLLRMWRNGSASGSHPDGCEFDSRRPLRLRALLCGAAMKRPVIGPGHQFGPVAKR